MPLANTLGAYADIAEDLNALLPKGGRRVCTSRSGAIRWRHRANKFRALLREQAGATPYDHFTFRIDPAEDNVVLITQAGGDGHLETLAGEPITPPALEDDPLLDEARRLAKELGLDPS